MPTNWDFLLGEDRHRRSRSNEMARLDSFERMHGRCAYLIRASLAEPVKRERKPGVQCIEIVFTGQKIAGAEQSP
jgi:hypothetical protein